MDHFLNSFRQASVKGFELTARMVKLDSFWNTSACLPLRGEWRQLNSATGVSRVIGWKGYTWCLAYLPHSKTMYRSGTKYRAAVATNRTRQAKNDRNGTDQLNMLSIETKIQLIITYTVYIYSFNLICILHYTVYCNQYPVLPICLYQFTHTVTPFV